MKLAYTVYEEEPILKFLPWSASWPAKLHSSLHRPMKVSMQKKKKKRKRSRKAWNKKNLPRKIKNKITHWLRHRSILSRSRQNFFQAKLALSWNLNADVINWGFKKKGKTTTTTTTKSVLCLCIKSLHFLLHAMYYTALPLASLCMTYKKHENEQVSVETAWIMTQHDLTSTMTKLLKFVQVPLRIKMMPQEHICRRLSDDYPWNWDDHGMKKY